MTRLTRRRFIQSTTAAAATTMLWPKPSFGRPNEEIRAAVVGLRGRGQSLISSLDRLPDVRIVALCDVDLNVLQQRAQPFADRGDYVSMEYDVRRIFERDDIDVVAIATPNHWHSLITIWACQAGKDVYVEKPVSHNVYEGRKAVEAARKYGRVVQTGTQSRSVSAIPEALAWMREGHLGAVRYARGLCYKPRQSIGHVLNAQEVPDTIDYDLWTGPAEYRPLTRRNLHYDWHWDFNTGNGDIGNQGIHQMDICRWAIGADTLPTRVTSVGGRFGYVDDADTPNTLITFLDYEPAPIIFEVRGLPGDAAAREGGWGGGDMDNIHGVSIGVIVQCEGGFLRIGGGNAVTVHDNDGNEIQRFEGGSDHMENFINVVRSRQLEELHADILEGHLSSALCHIGNIAYLVGQERSMIALNDDLRNREDFRLTLETFGEHLHANEIDVIANMPAGGTWLTVDPEKEQIVGHEDANRLITRPYREGFVVPKVV